MTEEPVQDSLDHIDQTIPDDQENADNNQPSLRA
jgi:hypothetical protein